MNEGTKDKIPAVTRRSSGVQEKPQPLRLSFGWFWLRQNVQPSDENVPTNERKHRPSRRSNGTELQDVQTRRGADNQGNLPR